MGRRCYNHTGATKPVTSSVNMMSIHTLRAPFEVTGRPDYSDDNVKPFISYPDAHNQSQYLSGLSPSVLPVPNQPSLMAMCWYRASHATWKTLAKFEESHFRACGYLRRDGFQSFVPNDTSSPATLTMLPIEPLAMPLNLHVNAACESTGNLSVALFFDGRDFQGQTGEVLRDGNYVLQSDPIIGDSTDHLVLWSGGSTLPVDIPFILEFTFMNCQLYSFWVEK